MHESGLLEECIAIGEAALAEPNCPLPRDVATAVALAYCDVAVYMVQDGGSAAGPDIVASYEDFSSALALLKKHRTAPTLQQDIAYSIEDLAPEYAATVLRSSPLDDADRRYRALDVLKDVLFRFDHEKGLSPQLSDRAAYIGSLQGCLTAAEQIFLYESRPLELVNSMPSEDTYDAALAYLGEAVMRKKPKLVQKAEHLLQRVLDHDLKQGNRASVHLELTVCAILLGDTERAVKLWAEVADPNVRGYVDELAGEDRDVIRGLCALAEQWIQSTVLAVLPEYQAISVNGASSLELWFTDREVASYLGYLERAQQLGINRVTGTLRRAVDAAVSAGVGAYTGALRTASSVGASASATLGKLGLGGKGGLPARAATGAPAPFGDVSSLEEVDEQLRGSAKAKTAAAYGGAALGIALLGFLALRAVQSGGVPQLSFGGGRPGAGGAGAGAPPNTVHAVEAARNAPAPTPSGKTGGTTGASAVVATKPGLTTAEAAALITRWQEVKAAALGGAHQTGRLEEVLEGKMLQQWKTRAEDVKHQGWHWEYVLDNLTIDKVEVSDDGRRALVEATLHENAKYVEGGVTKDTYSSTYSAQYQLINRGSWKISGGKILYR